MKIDFKLIDESKRNKVIAASFLLELELSRGSKTTDEEVDLFLDYASHLIDEKEAQ